MPSLKDLERNISRLSREEYRELRDWLLAHDGAAWDRQIEFDVRSGKLDRLAEAALRALTDGRTTRL